MDIWQSDVICRRIYRV